MFGKIKRHLARERIGKTFSAIMECLENPGRQPGEWLGIILGVKPALLLEGVSEQSKQEAQLILEKAGISTVFEGDLLMVPSAVHERVRLEREFAEKAGWDDSLSVQENAAGAWQYKRTKGKSDLLTGFILGFPQSAVLAYEKIMQVTRSGVPTIDIAQIGEDWSLEDIQWLKCAQAVIPTGDFRQIYFLPEIRSLYYRRYGATEEDYNFIANWVPVALILRQVYQIYAFSTAHDQVQAPDILELAGRVEVAASILRI